MLMAAVDDVFMDSCIAVIKFSPWLIISIAL